MRLPMLKIQSSNLRFQAPDWNEGSLRQGSRHRGQGQDRTDPSLRQEPRQVQGKVLLRSIHTKTIDEENFKDS